MISQDGKPTAYFESGPRRLLRIGLTAAFCNHAHCIALGKEFYQILLRHSVKSFSIAVPFVSDSLISFSSSSPRIVVVLAAVLLVATLAFYLLSRIASGN